MTYEYTITGFLFGLIVAVDLMCIANVIHHLLLKRKERIKMEMKKTPISAIPIDWIKEKIKGYEKEQEIAEMVEGDIPYWRELEMKKQILEELIDDWRRP